MAKIKNKRYFRYVFMGDYKFYCTAYRILSKKPKKNRKLLKEITKEMKSIEKIFL